VNSFYPILIRKWLFLVFCSTKRLRLLIRKRKMFVSGNFVVSCKCDLPLECVTFNRRPSRSVFNSRDKYDIIFTFPLYCPSVLQLAVPWGQSWLFMGHFIRISLRFDGKRTFCKVVFTFGKPVLTGLKLAINLEQLLINFASRLLGLNPNSGWTFFFQKFV